MASGIDALHESGSRVFAAVGALHMLGPRGLPSLVSEKGYRVEPIALMPHNGVFTRAAASSSNPQFRASVWA
jgi:uncharacterized protein